MRFLTVPRAGHDISGDMGMSGTACMAHPDRSASSRWTSPLAVTVYLALGTVVLHMVTGGQYGFHRDELATLDDARHLALGYPAYPPVTPFFGRISLELFGTSLRGFRFFAAVAQAIAVVLAGSMARQLGGGRWAQVTAAIAAIPFCIGGGVMMQYVSFDYLAWVLVAYCTLRLLESEDPRWWTAIGASIGFGLLSKYAMPFLVAGLGVGILVTPARRYLKSKWLWIGAAIAIVIFLPNLVWQVRHDFVSIDFLRHIHARDVGQGRDRDFLLGQLEITLLALPLWLAGLYFYLFARDGKRFRVVGWMYVVPLGLFLVGRGRSYYLAGTYPMLYAAGAMVAERWLSGLPVVRASIARAVIATALAVDIVFISSFTLPIAPVSSAWFRVAGTINGDFREEFGWQELAQTVAQIRDSLPAADRAHLGIFGANYGEAGAIDLYGPQYGLPPAISGVNTFWYRGYGDPPPQVLIIIGMRHTTIDRWFSNCKVAGHTWNRYGIKNEETTDHPDIYVCRGVRTSWQELWSHFQYYG
jgi:hypothetical protein